MPVTDLAGCYVISLRPAGGHAGLRRAAARLGARVLALSSCRLVRCDDASSRHALHAALAASRVVFTSPAAVGAARALEPLRPRPGQTWCAVGPGTARALARAGVDEVVVPQRMDGEGLLALPALQSPRGLSVGLVTAPGGRGVIAQGLALAGAQVLRADVYRRIATTPSPRAIAALAALRAPAWVALSSGEALVGVLAALPAQARARLLRMPVLAASDRLAALARALGFSDIVRAASARPGDLVAAAGHAPATKSTRPHGARPTTRRPRSNG